MTKDLTSGSPLKVILMFTLPLVLGNLFQQFYALADTIIVGRFCGVGALASVGATGSVNYLILGFVIGVCNGFAIPIAQLFGARDYSDLRRHVANAAWLCIAGSVVLTVATVALTRPMMQLMQTPADILDGAVIYIGWIFAGIPFVFLYNMVSAIMRALGDSKTPLYFLVLTSAVNIVLDLVFIIVFRMGAAGAAYATVIAQGISGILCLLYIAKKVPALYLHREDWEIDKNLAGWQLKIGLPMAFQYSITAIGTIVVQSCLNILGSTAAAGFAAASKIEQVFTQAYVALGTTMATYCAQNMGAGKYTRIRKGFKSATLIGFIYAVVTGVIIFFVGKYMTIFFVSENVNQIMEYVDIYLRCVSVSFLPLVIVNLYRNGIQGMGYGLLPMTAGIAELVGRSGASLIASHFGSYMGICLASPAAWVLAGTLLLIMYFEIMKGKKDRNLKNR